MASLPYANAVPSVSNSELSHDASLEANIGDLLFFDAADPSVKPASSFTDQGTEALTQRAFAAVYAGVSETSQLGTDSTGRPARFLVDTLIQFPCASSTFEIGDYVAPTYTAGVLSDQEVTKVTDPTRAIGKVYRRYSSATTTVRVRLTSRLLSGLVCDAGGNSNITAPGGIAAGAAGSNASVTGGAGAPHTSGTAGAGGTGTFTGGTGGAATTGTGGAGGATTVGGNTGGGVTTGTGGAGGAVTASSGAGGAATGAAGVGGAGGAWVASGGAGGASSDDAAGNGGAGGAWTGSGGAGGATTVGTGGAGGARTGSAGAGGAATGAAGIGGAGGTWTGSAGAGGAASDTSSGNAGAGGAWTGQGGAGGAATGTTAAPGGAGGAWTAGGGAGGAAAGTSAGGAGGAATLAGGAGGAKTGTGAAAGGAGGAVNVTAGAGGATASSGSDDAGAGGAVTVTAGAGGNASAGTGDGGAGGNINLVPGDGGSTTGGTAGADGAVRVNGKGFIPVTYCYNDTDLAVDSVFFVAAGSQAYRVTGIIGRPEVVGSDMGAVTIAVKKATSATAIASGTALHTGAFDLKGTAATNQTLSLSATAADLLIPAGTCIGVDLTGTPTDAVGCITVMLEPLG